MLIPQEVARRVAPQIGAVVAPPISYALSYPHVGFTGLVHIRIPTFMALIADLCASFAAVGFKRIIFLNGHYDNTYAIAYACADAADRMPKGVKAFPVNYWDGLTADEVAEFSGLKNGLHANAAETSAVLAINPDLVDLDHANAEFPPFPEFTVNMAPCTPPSSSPRPGRCIGRHSRARGAMRGGPRRKWASATSPPGSARRWRCWTTSRRPLPRCPIEARHEHDIDRHSETRTPR